VAAVLGGILALLCLGGVSVAYVVYDKATEADRSSPEVAVTNYLQALLMERDQSRAALYACEEASNLADVDALLAEIVDRERQLGVSITVNVENLRVERTDGTEAWVTVDLRRSATVDGVRQSLVDPWRFQVVDEDGWHVCGGAKA
jgi:hypothetical protein